ncbi:MAG: ABC transporter ATP-binding protein [Deltaproteobacteria bacterium]|nr:ABC transporter ATP-binding protein [Deltaproteobacteria bacterium]
MLQVEKIDTFYGSSQILFKVSLEVSAGEVVALLGRNGAGKTTTLRCIMGLTPPKRGSITYKGDDISGTSTYKIAKMGIGYVPENRIIFPDLSVLDNLNLASKTSPGGENGWGVKRVFELFPVLKSRAHQHGGTLSGGEQQMLTIARTLMGNPDLILVDEPTEGLAPLLVKEVRKLILAIAETGTTILLSEQNIKFSLKSSKRVYIIEKGEIQYEGTVESLRENEPVMKKYLAI